MVTGYTDKVILEDQLQGAAVSCSGFCCMFGEIHPVIYLIYALKYPWCQFLIYCMFHEICSVQNKKKDQCICFTKGGNLEPTTDVTRHVPTIFIYSGSCIYDVLSISTKLNYLRELPTIFII